MKISKELTNFVNEMIHSFSLNIKLSDMLNRFENNMDAWVGMLELAYAIQDISTDGHIDNVVCELEYLI